jgi:hypothetical protein
MGVTDIAICRVMVDGDNLQGNKDRRKTDDLGN